jgi:hypothetical protein
VLGPKVLQPAHLPICIPFKHPSFLSLHCAPTRCIPLFSRTHALVTHAGSQCILFSLIEVTHRTTTHPHARAWSVLPSQWNLYDRVVFSVDCAHTTDTCLV